MDTLETTEACADTTATPSGTDRSSPLHPLSNSSPSSLKRIREGVKAEIKQEGAKYTVKYMEAMTDGSTDNAVGSAEMKDDVPSTEHPELEHVNFRKNKHLPSAETVPVAEIILAAHACMLVHAVADSISPTRDTYAPEDSVVGGMWSPEICLNIKVLSVLYHAVLC